jgi:hypothetical protein
MPVQPESSENFIYALSDFWTVFFKDTTQIQSYFKGVELNLGQLYLELLETVLGTNLKNAPVFSKKYLKQLTVGEDEVFYVEGARPQDDRYSHTPADAKIAGISSLMNRVVAPTRVLEVQKDFSVTAPVVQFYSNIFDVDGAGNSLATFPARVVTKVFKAQYSDPLKRNWSDSHVRVGDYFRFQILGKGSAFTLRVLGVRENTLLLDNTRSEFSGDLSRKLYRVKALRTPYDNVKSGIPLAEHPSEVDSFSSGSTDALLTAGANTIDFSGETYYRGGWAASTLYHAGDLVINTTGGLSRAIFEHTSGASYQASVWTALKHCYAYVLHPSNPANNGLALILGTFGAVITVARPSSFSSAPTMRAKLYLIKYPRGPLGTPKPVITLDHQNLDVGSLVVAARRKHPVYIQDDPAGINSYAANEAVIEGVDYLVDYDSGSVTALSGWDPSFPARATYTWMYELVAYTYRPRGTWDALVHYAPGDIALNSSGKAFIARTATTNPLTSADWLEFVSPFSFDQPQPVRQIAFWGTDVLLDVDTLYNNFGYLLAFKRPSSEQYRAFLRGVAQLFVIGPTLSRFESALNVMADLPVVRDDGEKFVSYDSGILVSGTDGELIDSDEGRDGTLDALAGTFTATSSTFFPTDVGTVVRVKLGASYTSFSVINWISANTVEVSPAPPNGTNLIWNFSHNNLNRRFRVSSYAFSDADIGSVILISGSRNDRNNGAFKVVAIENASTAILGTPFGFTDETGLTWKLSRTNAQVVTTSRATYSFPLQVPIRTDVMSASVTSGLTFQSFEPLTSAFTVEDYIQDPTWWYDETIPQELVNFLHTSASRRTASTTLLEHKVRPLDDALIGDVGLVVGRDEEGNPGISRSGTAVWHSGPNITLSFPLGTPVANRHDVNTYVTLSGPGVDGQFRIVSVNDLGTLLELERFPTSGMSLLSSPLSLNATLAPLLYRRSVGFVLMDRFLKYHALRVLVDPATPLSTEFLGDAIQLLKEAKPAFTHVYFATPLDFLDTLTGVDMIRYLVRLNVSAESLFYSDPAIRASVTSLLHVNDAYRFVTGSQTIPADPGVYTLTHPLPPTGLAPSSVRFHAVKGWFNLAVTTPSGRQLCEGVDYEFDRTYAKVIILSPGLASSAVFNYVGVILRTRYPSETLDIAAGETPLAANGEDPTVWRALTQAADDSGFIDRAVQVVMTPAP